MRVTYRAGVIHEDSHCGIRSRNAPVVVHLYTVQRHPDCIEYTSAPDGIEYTSTWDSIEYTSTQSRDTRTVILHPDYTCSTQTRNLSCCLCTTVACPRTKHVPLLAHPVQAQSLSAESWKRRGRGHADLSPAATHARLTPRPPRAVDCHFSPASAASPAAENKHVHDTTRTQTWPVTQSAHAVCNRCVVLRCHIHRVYTIYALAVLNAERIHMRAHQHRICRIHRVYTIHAIAHTLCMTPTVNAERSCNIHSTVNFDCALKVDQDIHKAST